jgi:glycosyltransferase involved in cell wall biosynthesis
MKIMFVANVAWDTYIFRGGVIKNFVNAGHEVVVVAPDTGRVDIKKELGAKYIPITINKRGVNPIEDLKLLFTLKKIYDTEKPDFIFHYTIKPNIYGTLAAKLSKKNSIAVLTGLGYSFVSGGIISKVAQALYRFSLQFSKEVWVLNPDDKELLVSMKITPKKKIFILPGEGINTIHYTSKLSKKNPRGGKTTFLMIARAFFDKGFREFEEAARAIKKEFGKKVEFLFLGDAGGDSVAGVTIEHLQKLQEEDVLTYLGHRKDILDIIDKSDCLILPSYREGISRVLLEGASMQTPIITTDVAGCKDIVVNGINGFLIPPRNSIALIEAIKNFIELSSEEREKMGKAGRKIVLEKFDEKIIIEIYRNKLKEFTDGA